MADGAGEITRLLKRLHGGETGVRERLFELVYDELRRAARARMRAERRSHTLTATALVHETYLRLGLGPQHALESHGHLLAVACQVMRRVLVDHARARRALKRDGGNETEMPHDLAAADSDGMTLALDAALHALQKLSPRQCQVVELRYFGGLTETEVAETLGVTRRTVDRDWQMARRWLHNQLSRRGGQ